MRIVELTRETTREILENLLKRSPAQYPEYEEAVSRIVRQVRERGDEALFEYTWQFDHFRLSAENVRVSREEIAQAYAALEESGFLEIVRRAAQNIRAFHAKQLRSSWFDTKEDGIVLGMKVSPIERVGVYVPGGKAAYSSSVLMNVLPAKVAGVKEIIMLTPPGKDGLIPPETLAVADMAGVDAIYKAGGAQAVAAMAFGTASVPRVQKVVGPGNIYVTLAKKAVYGNVGIDSLAGPSEILVLADESANPRYIAADLLSQAEHDELASAVLITTSRELAEKVSDEVEAFLPGLGRTQMIRKALDNYGYLLVAPDMDEAIAAANEIASEHLEIFTRHPFDTMTRIRNAGAIFLGEYSSEPLGDYYAGPNHILPTNGTAKFFSPLNVDDFLKKSSIICYSKDALSKVHEDIESFAEKEGLAAHANSIRVRFERPT
ncbi:MAG: histidinol dehydrogenase [Clostridium sp.]|jgi:histidinol dehydrogenase|nr:histidinol dehydrogenase [Clostridium sp.]